jgi:hypothetical protein
LVSIDFWIIWGYDRDMGIIIGFFIGIGIMILLVLFTSGGSGSGWNKSKNHHNGHHIDDFDNLV